MQHRTLLLAIVLSLMTIHRVGAGPVVLITNVPPYGSTNRLAGRVLDADPASQAIAVFIDVPGYGWVSKPTCVQPLTPIQPDGSWSANINTGGGDTNATRIAALLVNTNFNEPCVLGLANLPTNIFAQALASAVVRRPSPGVRWLQFSGYDWWVKTSAGPVGPGPNYFSDSTSNVWVDVLGSLHLRITHRSNQWHCAEIVSARTFGHGHYRFELDSEADALNPNITLGLFTWSDDPVYAHRELDVECGRWNVPSDTNNAQFVVQPYDTANHLERYRVPPGLANSTHQFIWETNRVAFESHPGPHVPGATNLIRAWNFTNAPAVPRTGDENVRLNLWLFQGNPPLNSNEAEVILKSFQFVPLDPPLPASVQNLSLSNGVIFRAEYGTRPDFRYEVQTSSNLSQWEHLTTRLATNLNLQIAHTNSPPAGSRLYRVLTLP